MAFLPRIFRGNPIKSIPAADVNAQVGTTYTYAESDAGQVVTHSNAGAIAATVPPNSSVAYPIGCYIVAIQIGAGAITFTPGAGVTLNSSTGNLTTPAANSIVVLRKTGTNTWQLSGDLTLTSNVVARTTGGTVSGTVSKTDAWSFTVPGNKLGSNKSLIVELLAEFFSGTTTHTLTIEVSYGGTVLWSDVSTLQTAVATNHPVWLRLVLAANNSTSAQVLGGLVSMGSAAATTTGEGDLATVIASATGFNTPIRGTAAKDSTADQTYKISITLSATTNTSFITTYGIAYLQGEGQKGDTGAVGPTGTGAGSLPENPLGGRTSTSDTPLSTDSGVETTLSNASAITCTIPSSSYLTAGQIAFYRQIGAGAVTFVAGGGVTLDGTSLVTRAQFSVVAVRCISTTHFVLVGDTA